MSRFFMICLAGALGTGARYLVSGFALRLFGPAFAFGTLAVNMIGSFFVTFIMHVGLNTESLSPSYRTILVVGVMGGFTTYSAFNYETIRYVQDGEILRSIINIGFMLAACLVAGVLGLFAARWLVGR